MGVAGGCSYGVVEGNCMFYTGDADGCGSTGVEEVLGGLPRPPENGLTDNGERVEALSIPPHAISRNINK